MIEIICDTVDEVKSVFENLTGMVVEFDSATGILIVPVSGTFSENEEFKIILRR